MIEDVFGRSRTVVIPEENCSLQMRWYIEVVKTPEPKRFSIVVPEIFILHRWQYRRPNIAQFELRGSLPERDGKLVYRL